MTDDQALTDDELKAIAHEPQSVAKLTADERQRMVKLVPAERGMGPGDPYRPVTVGDLRADPMEAMRRIGAIVKKDVTDPKTWLAVAAAYFGPKMINAALPTVMRAASTASAMGKAAGPDLAKAALGYRAGKLIDAAQAVRTAARGPAAPAEPVPAPPPAAPTAMGAPPTAPNVIPSPPVSAAPAPSPSVAARPSPQAASTADLGRALKDLASQGHLTPAELNQALKWVKQGAAPEVILSRIEQSRQLTAALGTATPEEAAAKIANAKRTGKF